MTSVDVKHFDNTRIKKVFDTKPKFAPKQIIYKTLDLFRVAGALLENTHQQTSQFPPIGQRSLSRNELGVCESGSDVIKTNGYNQRTQNELL